MKCLLKYRWVKLPRAQLPQGKGVLGYWSRLAARAAFRKGTACYCGYHNEVVPECGSGGIVGLKSILGVRRRAQALQIMDQLQSLGYIRYSLDQKTKRLDYQICDWIISCSARDAQPEQYMPQMGMVSSASRAISHRGLSSITTNLKKQTHCWIYGATQHAGFTQCVFFFSAGSSVW